MKNRICFLGIFILFWLSWSCEVIALFTKSLQNNRPYNLTTGVIKVVRVVWRLECEARDTREDAVMSRLPSWTRPLNVQKKVSPKLIAKNYKDFRYCIKKVLLQFANLIWRSLQANWLRCCCMYFTLVGLSVPKAKKACLPRCDLTYFFVQLHFDFITYGQSLTTIARQKVTCLYG